jgi:hypothetical protein
VCETFDLKDAKTILGFVFWLYNFVSLANKDNSALRNPFGNVAELDLHVIEMGLKGLTSRKRKTRYDDDADNRTPKKRQNEGGLCRK